MDKTAGRVRGMFDAISPRYDLLNHMLSLGIDREWRKQTIRETIDADTSATLDVAAGTGDLTLDYAAALGERGRVVGADFAGKMLLLGREKAAKRGLANRAGFVRGDGLRLPFADDEFDVCSIAFGLRNFVDPAAGLRELIRVIRPGGRVAVLEFSMPRNPAIGSLYRLYLRHILPRIGNMVSGSDAYRYLSDTITEWPKPDALAEMMMDAGLETIRFHRLTFGIACLHIGEKGRE